jgi:hypothetical protein
MNFSRRMQAPLLAAPSFLETRWRVRGAFVWEGKFLTLQIPPSVKSHPDYDSSSKAGS